MKTDRSTIELFGSHKKQVGSSLGLLEAKKSCIYMGLFGKGLSVVIMICYFEVLQVDLLSSCDE